MANLTKTESIPESKADIYIYIWDSPSILRKVADFKSIVRWRLDQRVHQGQIVYVYEVKSDKYYLWRQFRLPAFNNYKEFTDIYKGYSLESNK